MKWLIKNIASYLICMASKLGRRKSKLILDLFDKQLEYDQYRTRQRFLLEAISKLENVRHSKAHGGRAELGTPLVYMRIHEQDWASPTERRAKQRWRAGSILRWLLLFLATSFLCPNNLFARTDDFSKPIDVKADRSEFDEKAGVQSLIGNVLITQGSMKISAERITVTLEDNKLSVIKGEGSPIKFSQENDAGELVEGECQNITYDAVNGRLTLIGNATLTEPKQRLRSEKIVFDSLTQTVVAEGGRSGQVNITIQPPDQK